jgi:hypothetical protein
MRRNNVLITNSKKKLAAHYKPPEAAPLRANPLAICHLIEGKVAAINLSKYKRFYKQW